MELLSSQVLSSNFQLSTNEPKNNRTKWGNIPTAPTGIPANLLPLMPQMLNLFEPSNYSIATKNKTVDVSFATAPAPNHATVEAADMNETIKGTSFFYALPVMAYQPPKQSHEKPAELLARQELPSNLQLFTNEPKNRRARLGNIATAQAGIQANPLPLMLQILNPFEPSNYSAAVKNKVVNNVFNNATKYAISFVANNANNAVGDTINHATEDDTSISVNDSINKNEAIDNASNYAANDTINGASNYAADNAREEAKLSSILMQYQQGPMDHPSRAIKGQWNY